MAQISAAKRRLRVGKIMDSKIIFRGSHGGQFVEFVSGVASGSGSSFSVLENGSGEDSESQTHEARC